MVKKNIHHTADENKGILINVLLDRSGSMSGRESDVIGHYNAFIKEQRSIPGEARVSLVIFDTEYEEVYLNKDIHSVPKLTSTTYFPRGGTALLDSLGKLITSVDAIKDKPEKILFVINTDGFENSSREFNRDQIKALVQERTNNHGWEFLFIGAGLDAFAEAQTYGVAAYSTFTGSNTAAGFYNSTQVLNSVTRTMRTTGAGGQSLYDTAYDAVADSLIADSAAPDTAGASADKLTKKKKVTTSK